MPARDRTALWRKSRGVVIRPARHPRAGWDEDFARMAVLGDDAFVDDDWLEAPICSGDAGPAPTDFAPPNELEVAMSEPIITPAIFLGQHELPGALAGCTTAVVGFCRFNTMREKLAAAPLGKRYFSHVDESHQFAGTAGGRAVVAVDCLYGGPQAATVLEELAHYGVKHVVAHGWAGSLRREVPVATALLAAEAVVSDGTSREYCPEGGLALPDPLVYSVVQEEVERAGLTSRPGRIWTTDAIYREYPEKVAAWRQAGADAVNMDTSYLYAISRVVGLTSAYACVISDCVEGPVWEEGFARARQAMHLLQNAVVAAAGRLAAE